jgi:YhcH/YjgK/YiaL family protein
MIFDALRNAECYQTLGPGFAQAFHWLRTHATSNLEPGTHEIDGRKIYAMVQHNELKQEEMAVWESHRRYADIQYLAKGSERMGVSVLRASEVGDYNEVKDFSTHAARPGNYFLVNPGEFALFLPQDAHRPGLRTNCDNNAPESVIKIVIKVQLD